MRRQIHAFDRVVGRYVENSPRWLTPIMELFTLLGQPPFTVGISAFALGYGLALDKQFYINAGLIAIATISVGALLKIPLRRARPVNDYVKSMMFQTFSFPSGHAAGAMVSYGLAAVVIAGKWPELAIVAWTGAIIGIFLVSLSRIYLGAHYPSDVIGGWLVGGIGLLLIFVLER